jgi:hypothetical protein
MNVALETTYKDTQRVVADYIETQMRELAVR